MTCIVGIIENEKVYIAGDSAGVAGLDITIRKDPKVFKTGEFVIGCTSSFRMINILRYSFAPPELSENEDIYKYMCTKFINAVRQSFKDAGWLEIDKNIESGGTFLVGLRGRLFKIESNFQVAESIDKFASVGCGDVYAVTVLKMLESEYLINANDKLTKALEMAVYFSGGVRPPFNYVES